MTADDNARGAFSLKRWSRRKLEAARSAASSSTTLEPARETPPAAPARDEAASSPPAASRGVEPAALPPVDSLTIDSDFTAFLRPEVAEKLKQTALKQLFRDPHFNVMDGLDVYIDDYSRPDPIPADLVRELVQGRYVFDPPRTRVNAQGVVEDVPPEESATSPPAAPAERLPEAEPAASPVTGAASSTLPSAAATSPDGVVSGPVDDRPGSRS